MTAHAGYEHHPADVQSASCSLLATSFSWWVVDSLNLLHSAFSRLPTQLSHLLQPMGWRRANGKVVCLLEPPAMAKARRRSRLKAGSPVSRRAFFPRLKPGASNEQEAGVKPAL